MIKQIRTSKVTRIVSCYLALMILLEMLQPMAAYALTGGPSQPEFESFTPIGTSDMVDLASGDFNYNLPIMDVGGYPLNLSYTSTATMDQEASWVGLGWDLNVGQITRQMRGLPDDFNGDKMIYENNLKENVTVGANMNAFVAGFGVGEASLSANIGIGVKYNNYDGLGCSVNGGLAAQIGENLSVGMQMESSATEGVSISPSISFDKKFKDKTGEQNSLGGSLGMSYNNRKGVESVSMSFRAKRGENSRASINAGTSLSFVDASFTPSKRVGMMSDNYMFAMNIQGEIYGVEPGAKFSGYRTSQGVKNSEKYKEEKGYGYENHAYAGWDDILDFNREKDRTFTKNTASLPITNNTYDIYSVQGQGVGGVFRPYRSQVGYVFDNRVADASQGGSLGGEVGAMTKFGFDATVTVGNSRTSVWSDGNPALNRFFDKTAGSKPDYERIYFKTIGGTVADAEMGDPNTADPSMLFKQMGGYEPVKFQLEGGKFYRMTHPRYTKKYDGNFVNHAGPIKRTGRVSRNQTIQRFTKQEVQNYRLKSDLSPYAAANHTAEIRVINEGGQRYIYGRAAYNKVKKETTFDSGNTPPECATGQVHYNPGYDNSANNRQTGDQFFNRITTPAYAHSYLLTSVLSSDYQDLKMDGPTDDDLGTYTKFEYDNKTKDNLYKWRIPYTENFASYDEGLKSDYKDQKASYQYGEKEILYIKKIVTKTHVAIFHISPRLDAHGVKGENGGFDENGKMYKLDKISLYSKPEYLAQGDQATPIKEAHFVYDYSLCQGIENHANANNASPVFDGQRGKLTLNKIYFTYKGSNMGKFTPYVFDYGDLQDASVNPSYNLKAFDIWGNYKPLSIGCTTFDALSNAEFPYVEQGDRQQADKNASVWLLREVRLPSGGTIKVNYESDDYSHVQNHKAMQMFKVVGAGTEYTPTAGQAFAPAALYGPDPYRYLYLRLNEDIEEREEKEPGYFNSHYLRSLANSPIYFRFLLNMAKPGGPPEKYDYVTGYLNLDFGEGRKCHFNGNYVSIPIKYEGQGDGSNPDVHPVSKAGWFFGRQYLNRVVFDAEENTDTANLKNIVMQLIDAVKRVGEMFKSGNKILRQQGTAQYFVTEKSWVRLMQPNGRKIGGGSRVSEISMHDQWDVMTNHPDNNLYKQHYGQRYSYTKDGVSSGVATYEPLGSKENPIVQPFYDHSKPSLLLAPESQNYVEMPFGECYFPSPKITYSCVTVENLPRSKTVEGTNIYVQKNATGRVVTEFYTSKDYPTIVDYTIPSAHYDKSSVLAGLLNIRARDHLTMTQGFSVHTNDMDGKKKSERVYGEGQVGYISGVDYKYKETTQANPGNAGRLNNMVKTIDAEGKIKDQLVGVDSELINDFRSSSTMAETYGMHFNTAGMIILIFYIVIPTPLPNYNVVESQINTAVSTKVTHTSGILSETIAYEDGAAVSTKNLAWDAQTGAVLATETVNEYNDKYYSFNFPAYWGYKGMSQSAVNAGLEWDITGNSAHQYTLNGNPGSLSKYLIDGDELFVIGKNFDNRKRAMRAWVVKQTAQNTFKLLYEDGQLIPYDSLRQGRIKVIRSGHRNMQNANMATVSMMKNPLVNSDGMTDVMSANPFVSTDGATGQGNYRILNASAITYKDQWPAQCECNLPKMTYDAGKLTFEYEQYQHNIDIDEEPEYIRRRSYNPYLYNVLGNWRADRSYAYLTGRTYTSGTPDPVTRNTGFFKQYAPLYVLENNKWKVTTTQAQLDKWQYASAITQFNPAGQEIENKDALERYSSAYYGYNNRFPVAVASNTQYSELAFDGFEDYDFSTCTESGHFNFHGQLNERNITVSDKQAHTGRRSLRIAPMKSVTVSKRVASCPAPAPASRGAAAKKIPVNKLPSQAINVKSQGTKKSKK